MKTDKLILDACCGSRMMWFDKQNPSVLFGDIRNESHVLCDGRALEINPDTILDFTSLKFPDESFHLVVFDPPHLNKLGSNSWTAKKYGKLLPSWETDIKAGFEECWRVTKINGIIIFKWNEFQIPIKKIIEVIGHKPLFGHPTRHSKTIWMTFMKL